MKESLNIPKEFFEEMLGMKIIISDKVKVDEEFIIKNGIIKNDT